MSFTNLQRFKIILVGDQGVGKTTLIHRHLTGNFRRVYTPTLGVDVNPLMFHTNHGSIVFDCWDIAGDLGGAYFMETKGVIMLFDVLNQASYDHLDDWRDTISQEAVPIGTPTVVCGNKIDCKDRVVIPKDIHCPLGVMYYDISARSNFNYEKPFLYLARKLTGYEDLEFVPEPLCN